MTRPTTHPGEEALESAPEGEIPRIPEPWMTAPELSWWVVTGGTIRSGAFTNCIAQVAPSWLVPDDDPEFLVHTWGRPELVAASAVTEARRLIFVEADAPTTAYYPAEQTFLTKETTDA